MLPFRDVLNALDQQHLRRILGEKDEGLESGTTRHLRVSRLASGATFLSEDSLQAFQALSQPNRERLISDVIWRLTCYVEGSITRVPGVDSYSLECGFKVVQSEEKGRDIFCVVKKE